MPIGATPVKYDLDKFKNHENINQYYIYPILRRSIHIKGHDDMHITYRLLLRLFCWSLCFLALLSPFLNLQELFCNWFM